VIVGVLQTKQHWHLGTLTLNHLATQPFTTASGVARAGLLQTSCTNNSTKVKKFWQKHIYVV